MNVIQRLYQTRVDAAEAALAQAEAAREAAEAERDGIAGPRVPAAEVLDAVVCAEDLWGPARFEEANQRRRVVARARVAECEADVAAAVQGVQGARRRLAMAERLAERAAAAQERLAAERQARRLEDNWRMARAWGDQGARER